MSTFATVYNQSVKVESTNGNVIDLIKRFLAEYYTVTQMSGGKETTFVDVVYASKITKYNVWYFLTNQYKHLLMYLSERGIDIKEIKYTDERNYNVVPAEFKVKEGWSLRDLQIPVYDFILSHTDGSCLVPLVPGSGKTAISMLAAAAIKVRMAIIILPTFMEKWASDIDTIHETNIKKELFVIQGSKSICSIVDMARNGELTQNYLIFSSRTMQDFIRMYEEEPENCVEMYGCAPSELFPLLGVGLLLIDETHMAYHAMYKIVTHCNVKYQVGLSATLMSEDNVVKRAHKVMYPTSRVYGDKMQKRYLEVYPISYGLTPDSSKKIRVTNYGSNMYSHTAFERSVMKHGRLLEAYYAIIKETVDMYYIEGYMKDDKLVIFVAMIDMADKLLVRLQRDYPGKKSVRYCQDDAYEDMLKGDIIVTTPGSLGTGIDVPHLRVAIATVSISSPVSNIQMSGRLRELKDRNVKYCYLYSNNIQKHVQHHRKRLETLAGYTKDFVHRRSRYQLG